MLIIDKICIVKCHKLIVTMSLVSKRLLSKNYIRILFSQFAYFFVETN